MQFLLLIIQIASLATASSSSSGWIPWQSELLKESEIYQDLSPAAFAPQGRLYSVERVLRAVSSKDDMSANLAVALTCRDGIVLVTTIPRSPYLHHRSIHTSVADTVAGDGESATDGGIFNGTTSTSEEKVIPLWMEDNLDKDSLFSSSSISTSPIVALEPQRRLWAVTGGNAVDSQILRRKIQLLAESWWESNDDGSRTWGRNTDAHLHGLGHRDRKSSTTPAAVVARRLADHLQLPTQSIGGRSGRMLVSSALLLGKDREIWRVDPSGQFWLCHAGIVGRAAEQAQTALLKLIATAIVEDTDEEVVSGNSVQAYLEELSIEDALAVASQCILEALGSNDIRSDLKEDTEKTEKTTATKFSQRMKGFSMPTRNPTITHTDAEPKAKTGVTRSSNYRMYDENELLSLIEK